MFSIKRNLKNLVKKDLKSIPKPNCFVCFGFLGNAWSDINSRFNEQFTLSSYIWTKYVFASHVLDPGQDQTECGVRCELSVEQCDFFTISSGNCHLGRYSYWDQGIIEDQNSPTTYHKSGI